MEALYILIWVALSGVAAAVASGKGRSGVGWFFIALLLTGPVIAIVIVSNLDSKNDGALAYGSEPDERELRQVSRLQRSLGY